MMEIERVAERIARDAEDRGEGICCTCTKPIWNEGGTINGREVEEGWSDRIAGRDSLVCFAAIDYRHVPLTGREAFLYDLAYQRGATGSSEDPRSAEEQFLDASYVEDLSPKHGDLDETVDVIQPGHSEAESKTEAEVDGEDWPSAPIPPQRVDLMAALQGTVARSRAGRATGPTDIEKEKD